jgi:HAD superfamily hydrolase (TIGR01509 family)
VDSEPIAARVLAETMTELGWPLSAEDCIERFTGFSLSTVLQRIEADWGQPLPPDLAEAIAERDRVAFLRDLKPMEGVETVLDEIVVPKCVASSGSLRKIRHNLGITGLHVYFEPYLFSAQMVKAGKPAPDLFLDAARRMGIAASACTVIEDSVAGIEAARAAGMRALGFSGGSHCSASHRDRLLGAGAEEVFSQMPDLLRILSNTDAEGPPPPRKRGAGPV